MPDLKIDRLAQKMENFMIENAKTTTAIATHVEHFTKEFQEFKFLVQEHYITKETLMPLQKELNQLQKVVDEELVTKVEFNPVKKITYAAISLILLTVFGAVIKGVLK